MQQLKLKNQIICPQLFIKWVAELVLENKTFLGLKKHALITNHDDLPMYVMYEWYNHADVWSDFNLTAKERGERNGNSLSPGSFQITEGSW